MAGKDIVGRVPVVEGVTDGDSFMIGDVANENSTRECERVRQFI